MEYVIVTPAKRTTKKYIKFVPIREDGQLLAMPWRVFSQRDEIYFAHQRMLTAFGIKFSIHSDEKWWFAAQKDPIRLAPGRHVPDTKWLHIAEIDFYVNEGAHPPQIAPDEGTIGILVPKAHKLVVDLWRDLNGSDTAILTTQFNGTVIWKNQLRHSGIACATASVLLLTERDAECIAFFEKERPPKGTLLGELEMFRLYCHPTDGNIIQVYPLSS